MWWRRCCGRASPPISAITWCRATAGLIAWLRLTQEVEQVNASLEILRPERARLEHKVALLRPDSLDLDLLEERARVVLGLGHPRDLVIVED